MMEVQALAIPGLMLITPQVFGDARGFFLESWNEERYANAGLDLRFVQDNVSRSERGVLRGLHSQHPHGQGKLVQVLDGEVFDVAVDLRRDSPYFSEWVGVRLSADNHHQFYIPPGFGHGFLVLSGSALFSYKCTELYSPEDEFSIRWDDPDIGIDWPLGGSKPNLSEKDAAAPTLAALPPERLPGY